MIYLIIGLVLLYCVIFALLLLKTLIYKDASGKRKFTTQNLRTHIVLSKMLWALIGTFALLYTLSLMLPLIWMLMTSVKGDIDFLRNTFGFPKAFHFENFAIVFSKIEVVQNNQRFNIFDMLINSLFYSFVKPLNSVFWMAVVAYALSRFKFVGSKFIYNLGIFIMMVPITGGLASRMIIYSKMGLYDNLIVQVILPPSTPFSGMFFMILYGALKAIPQTYSEAAYIDGASEYRVMFRIIIPMVIPTCITIYILEFINFWNVYQDFLIWFPSSPNIAYGMYKFQMTASNGSEGISTPQVVAGLMIIMIPSLVLYLSGQKIMKSNFTVGGLKG